MGLLDSFPHKCKIERKDRALSPLGGGKDVPTVEQEDVLCWEQQLSASEIQLFERQGISANRKIYFLADPGIHEQYQITITERQGTAVAAADQLPMDVVQQALPDASAGLGIVYKVICNQIYRASQV